MRQVDGWTGRRKNDIFDDEMKLNLMQSTTHSWTWQKLIIALIAIKKVSFRSDSVG